MNNTEAFLMVNNHVSGFNSIFHIVEQRRSKFPSFYQGGITEAARYYQAVHRWTKSINIATSSVSFIPIANNLYKAQRTNNFDILKRALVDLAVLAACYVNYPIGAVNYVLCLILGPNWLHDYLLKPCTELLKEIEKHVGIGFSNLVHPFSRFKRHSAMSQLFLQPKTLRLKMKKYDIGTKKQQRPDPFILAIVYSDAGHIHRINKVGTNIQSNVLATDNRYYEVSGFKELALGSIAKKIVIQVKDRDIIFDDLLGEATYSGSCFGVGGNNNGQGGFQKTPVTMVNNNVISLTMQFIWRVGGKK